MNPCPYQQTRTPGRPGYRCELLDANVAARVCHRCRAAWPGHRPPRTVRQAKRYATIHTHAPTIALGDLVHTLARPFARLFRVKKCQACNRRRRWLNRWRFRAPRWLARLIPAPTCGN